MTDQSYHVDLNAAILDFATFDVKDWRYFNLSSASVSNVPDTLSSEEDPLDLSGAILSYVGWLQGKSLDYINLGCYPGDAGSTTACPAPSGNMVCTTLKGTVLTGSSLKRACLNNASMEGVFLGYSNLDGADLSGALLGASTDEATTLLGGKAGTLEGAFMRNVDMSGANVTGVIASNINFYRSSSSLPTALANGITAPGANFSQAYMAGADFSGSTSNLQSTNWSGAMLINVDFSQADLSINTSGGINSGTNSTFNGAYLQGALFSQANISDVDFTSTYWDVSGNNGKLNFLIPISNLSFTGYWKCTDLPECPAPEVEYPSGISLPSGTDADNTCPNGLPGPCDKVWDQPTVDISHAYFQSATPGFPQVSEVADDNQCDGANNPADYSWTYTCETTCEENK